MRAISSMSFGFIVAMTSACGNESTPGNPGMPDVGPTDVGTMEVGTSTTFYRDVKPIIDGKCVACHQAGSIGPFDLRDPATVSSLASSIASQVMTEKMPPWPPGQECRSYRHDRSLDPQQIKTVLDWATSGAEMGDPSEAVDPVPSDFGGLSRVDLRIQVPEPYTPPPGDDYHCFVIDWPVSDTTFVAGFGLEPGNTSIVHHVNMYIAAPAAADGFRQRQADAEGPGYPCFGGVVGTGISLMGAWAPGGVGLEYPEGTGIQVDTGSVLVLEMHFNASAERGGSDQSTVLLKTESTVRRRAAILPLVDLTWPSGGMPIPAGEADVKHTATYEGLLAMQAVGFLAPWLAGQVLEIHATGVHMHYLGRRGRMEITRPNMDPECVIDVQDWDFDWQAGYLLETSTRFDPARDTLRLECTWDNTAENQPVIDGVQRPAADTNWGPDSADEMCIGYLYVTGAE